MSVIFFVGMRNFVEDSQTLCIPANKLFICFQRYFFILIFQVSRDRCGRDRIQLLM
jgi:hypothetical protein